MAEGERKIELAVDERKTELSDDDGFIDRKHTQLSLIECAPKDSVEDHKKEDEKGEPKAKKRRRNYSNREKGEWLCFIREQNRGQNFSWNHQASLIEEHFGSLTTPLAIF